LNNLALDCPAFFNTGEQTVLVSSTNKTFQSNGTLTCKNGGALFFQNGTATLSNVATCSLHATWTDQENIQCWKGWFRTESLLKRNIQFLILPCFIIVWTVTGQYEAFRGRGIGGRQKSSLAQLPKILCDKPRVSHKSSYYSRNKKMGVFVD